MYSNYFKIHGYVSFLILQPWRLDKFVFLIFYIGTIINKAKLQAEAERGYARRRYSTQVARMSGIRNVFRSSDIIGGHLSLYPNVCPGIGSVLTAEITDNQIQAPVGLEFTETILLPTMDPRYCSMSSYHCCNTGMKVPVLLGLYL